MNKKTITAQLKYPLILSLLALSTLLQAQAYFTTQDTICIEDSLVIENLSRDASTYYWNFCSGNLAYDPEGENLKIPGDINDPAFIDFAEDNENYYAFITNHNEGTITRNFYGDDFLSDPVSENLGSFGSIIPLNTEGVQVVQNSTTGNWHVFIVGGQKEEARIIRLDFGSSLATDKSSVVANDLGNIGDLDYPVDLFITEVDSDWIGFTVNSATSEVTRFLFDSGIDNPPTGENLGNPGGLDTPCGILPIQEDGNWYIFISSNANDKIIRLDFGNSLLSTPSATAIADEALVAPFDLTIINDCERTYGFVLNKYNDIVRMEFNDRLDGDPEFRSLGEIGDLYNPHGISEVFRVGDTLYTFVANIDNSTLTRLFFPGCTNASPASSEERDPPTVTYDQPGLYNVNLVIDEGLANQENYCVNVVVLDSPDLDLGNDTSLAAGASMILGPDTTYSLYDWSTGSTEPTLEIFEPGTYILSIENEFGCEASDDILVILDIGIPNFFTPNSDGFNDTWNIPILVSKPETEIWVYDRFGNTMAHYYAGNGEWDGNTNGRPVPEGTYWYIIQMPGVNKPYKGSVSIKR